MARKSPKEAPKESPAPPPPEKEEVEEKEAEEEVVDIDLDDPEVNEAAKKMQACFKARKKTVWNASSLCLRLGFVVLEQ